MPESKIGEMSTARANGMHDLGLALLIIGIIPYTVELIVRLQLSLKNTQNLELTGLQLNFDKQKSLILHP